MKTGIYPIRTCFGCNGKEPKKTLVRLAVDAQGGVHLDLKQRMEGRGVYVHPREECLKRAAKRRLPRQIGVRISGPALFQELEQLAAELGDLRHKGVAK